MNAIIVASMPDETKSIGRANVSVFGELRVSVDASMGPESQNVNLEISQTKPDGLHNFVMSFKLDDLSAMLHDLGVAIINPNVD